MKLKTIISTTTSTILAVYLACTPEKQAYANSDDFDIPKDSVIYLTDDQKIRSALKPFREVETHPCKDGLCFKISGTIKKEGMEVLLEGEYDGRDGVIEKELKVIYVSCGIELNKGKYSGTCVGPPKYGKIQGPISKGKFKHETFFETRYFANNLFSLPHATIKTPQGNRIEVGTLIRIK